MCTESVDKEKEKFDILLELINKTLCEGEEKLRKKLNKIVK